jgi:hypothetical protein
MSSNSNPSELLKPRKCVGGAILRKTGGTLPVGEGAGDPGAKVEAAEEGNGFCSGGECSGEMTLSGTITSAIDGRYEADLSPAGAGPSSDRGGSGFLMERGTPVYPLK